MHALGRLFIPFVVSTLAMPAHAVNAGHFEIADFADIRRVIDDAVALRGADQVLVVFDLDNTTLATDFDLGSEHWFLWQSELIKAGRFEDGAVTRTIEDLLTVQGWIYQMTGAHLTEARIAQDVADLSAAGVKFMALTSRGLDVRDATLRELVRNGIDLAGVAPGPPGGYGGAYAPYDLSTPEASGLSADDVAKFNLSTPKDVVFERGVMLTQGQHKGIMLRTLLAKVGADFGSIIFFDDRPHHSENVQAAFEVRPEYVSTIRYTHEVPRVDAFKASDKAMARRQWCDLGGGLSEAFGVGKVELLLPCAAPGM